MTLLLALLTGLLVAAGTLLLMGRRLLHLVLGLALLSHGANLLLFSSGGTSTRPAFSPGGEPLAGAADPLPQALILTALVIGFAATAFLLALSWRAWREIGDDKVAGWRTSEPPADEELPDEAHAPQPGAEDGP